MDKLGWTKDHLLQKDEILEICPLDAGHRIPSSSLQNTSIIVTIRKEGIPRKKLTGGKVLSFSIISLRLWFL